MLERDEKVIEELRDKATDDLEENLYLLAKVTRKRVRQDWDAVYGITGEEGVGKSTFAVKFGQLCDDNFDIRRNVIFNPDIEQIKEKITKLPKYSVVDVDEAIKVMYKLNWFDKLQIMLNVIYGLCRRENKISLLLMPRFTDFNEYFRNHRIKLWIHIVDRGHAIVFAKSWSPFENDPWLLKENRNVIREAIKKFGVAMPLDKKLKLLRNLPTYLMELKFPDMTAEEKKLFEEERAKSGVYEIDTGSKVEMKWKKRFIDLVNYLTSNKILTLREIARIVGCSPGLISQARAEVKMFNI